MPTLWFRNAWSFDPDVVKPIMQLSSNEFGKYISADHPQLGKYHLYFNQPSDILFTENETNNERLYGIPNPHPYVKDAFHEVIVNGKTNLLQGKTDGTKAAMVYRFKVKGFGKEEIHLRLSHAFVTGPPLEQPGKIFDQRIQETNEFGKCLAPVNADPDLSHIMRQAISGIFWSKQFYYYEIDEWLTGDKGMPAPPPERYSGRNNEWPFLNNRDIILMPDTWEYPW